MKWDGMRCDGKGRDEMGWNGIGCDGWMDGWIDGWMDENINAMAAEM